MQHTKTPVLVTLVAIAISAASGFMGTPGREQSAAGTCIPRCRGLYDFAGDALMRDIDGMIAEMKADLRSSPGPDRLKTLNDYFFHRWGFHGDRSVDDINAIAPATVLSRRIGNCTGLAIIYQIIAQRMNLSVFAVATPRHVFMRTDDAVNPVNIELLEGGQSFDDAWYVRTYRIPERALKNGVFLRSLSEQEFLGYVYMNLGVAYSRKGDYVSARTLYRAALSECDRLPGAWYNLANDFLLLGRTSKAIRFLDRSLRLYPDDPRALNNRGLAFCKQGDLHRAHEDFEAALAIDPTFQLAAQNLDTLQCGSKSGGDE